ncbi:squamosa promoter-binding protein 2-like [Olea europaea var. sylvestris]|uniref:squamosa promoter-binding protein 2-like n=1 Tax=Olea europaea var. sylvestris TaxID=158386 RepID=UPI000C1D4D38|nr:squamosa promoter-binding protein 2-like [Olea europaea var. sylvestris]
MHCTHTYRFKSLVGRLRPLWSSQALYSFHHKMYFFLAFLPTFSQHALSFIITTCHLFAVINSIMKIKKMLEDKENGFEEEEEMAEEDEMVENESNLKKKRLDLGGGGSGMSARAGGEVAPPCCAVDKCEVDLRACKKYYQRHKVCEVHSKAPEVIVSGVRQRFCQQCSRFQEVSEFDQTKRSCRMRLAGHNQRRRKSSSRLVKRAQTTEDSRKTSPGSLMDFSEKKSYKIAWMSL